MKKQATPPRIPDEPYAHIRVETGGTFYISWGLGWGSYGATYRRSIAAAVRLRDRKLRRMEVLYARTRLAEQALAGIA